MRERVSDFVYSFSSFSCGFVDRVFTVRRETIHEITRNENPKLHERKPTLVAPFPCKNSHGRVTSQPQVITMKCFNL